LEYATDIGSNWILNGSSLYPLATSTNVLIGTATNTNSKKFLVNGSSEFKGQLTIDTTGDELSNGTNTYALPSSSGTLALTSDIASLWEISSNQISPITTANILSIPSGKAIIGTTAEHYYLETDFTNNQFRIAEQDDTTVFQYDSDNGYIDWGTIGSARMNFGNYILHGNTAAYPDGLGIPFGTIETAYINQAVIRTIGQCGEIVLNAFNSNPTTGSSTIRANTSNEIYFSAGKLRINNIIGDNNSSNTIVSVTNGWELKNKLFLSSTSDAEIQIDNNSDKGIHFNSATNEGFKLFADNSMSGTAVINGLAVSNTYPLLQLEKNDTPYHKFYVGSTETYSNSFNLSRNYFVKSSNNSIGTYIESNFTDDTFNLKTFTSTYDEVFMSVDLTNNNQRTTTFEKCSQFTISSGAGSNGDCELLIKADTDNTNEFSNPKIRLQQDGAQVQGLIELTSNNHLQISTTETGSDIVIASAADVEITGNTRIDGNVTTNQIIGYDDSDNIIVSNSTYGWEFKAGTLGRQISIPDITNYPFIGCDNTNNYLIYIQNIGDAYTISGTSTSNLTHNFTGKIQVNTIEADNESSNTIVSNSLYGWEFRGTSTRYNISFPNGTYYPFLGTESSNPYFIHINNIGDAYQISGTSTSTLTHKLLGQTIIDGASTNPALKFQSGSDVYCQMGEASTFPSSNMGAWNSQTIPIGDTFYIGGLAPDGEGFNLAMNGNTMMISNPGDSNTLRWYDEDGLVLGWQITPTGGITPGSDRRIKSEITTYKNSNFEKYKQIRTITYKKKIPDNINPKRLEKQSCINKYNNIHFGIVAQEIYSLYPELEETQSIRDRKEYYYRKDNWDNGVYEEEYKQWLIDKEKFECENQEQGKECCYKQKEPQKIFDEEEPMRTFGYDKLSILSIGVIQDLITENEKLRTELDTYKALMNKLINAKSFADFKKNIA
jgi:hypothetical protein